MDSSALNRLYEYARQQPPLDTALDLLTANMQACNELRTYEGTAELTAVLRARYVAQILDRTLRYSVFTGIDLASAIDDYIPG